MHRQSTADQTGDGLVLEILPNGEPAWLRPDHHRVRVVDLVGAHWSSDERTGSTELGRDYLARDRAFEALFGPWPTVAEACRLEQDRVA